MSKILADIYKIESTSKLTGANLYTVSITLEAENEQDLVAKIADALGVSVEVKPKNFCGAV